MIRVLVTGGAGFIGSHVVEELYKILPKDAYIDVYDDLSGGYFSNVLQKDRIYFKIGDIRDDTRLARLFSINKYDYVYHFAAYAAEGLSHFIRKYNYDTNIIGSMNLINLSIKHKVKCFIFASSIATYGDIEPPMREDMHCEPEDPYGIAKLAVEQDLRAAKKMFGLNSIIFRPHNVYGERQNLADPYRNVVGIFINKALKGQSLPIFGDGQQTRAFSYIRDISGILAGCYAHKDCYNQTFNIGGMTPYHIRDLAVMVKDVVGSKSEIEYLPARNEVVDAYSDHSKIKEFFGEQPYTLLIDGLKKMVQWAKTIDVGEPLPFKNGIEIEYNMPEAWKKLFT